MHCRRHFLLGWAFALLVCLVCATGQDSAPGLQTRAEIPFKLVAGFGVLIRGDIGPAHNLNLLLDTGAVPSVLNKRLALQLGVVGPRGQFSLVERDLEAEYVTVKGVRIGPLYRSELPMVVVNLQSLEQLLSIRIDAIIGLDLLRGENFSVDYKRKKISLGLLERADHAVQAEIENQAGAPYWIVPITVQGTKFRMLLDTGTDSLKLFPGHSPVLRDVIGGTSAAALRGEQAFVIIPEPVALIFGDQSFRKQLVLLKQEPPGTLRSLDGLLGPKSLGLSVIAFDWEHKSLLWSND